MAAHGSCLSWLFAHTRDGVIHIEAPRRHPFTLDKFLSIWGTSSRNWALPRSCLHSMDGRSTSLGSCSLAIFTPFLS